MLLIIPLFLLFLGANAQIEQPLRVEIELENNRDDYTVIPVAENGVVTYTETDERVERFKKQWVFTGYDNQFAAKWKSGYVIHSFYRINDHELLDENLFVLFKKYRKANIQVAVIDTRNGLIQSVPATLPKNFEPSGMKVVGNGIYLHGIFRKKPIVAWLDLSSGICEIVKTEFDGKPTFESLNSDSANNRADVVFTVRKRGRTFLNIKSYRNNVLLSDLIIQPEDKDRLLTAKITSVSEREKIIIGTYSAKDNLTANGMYFARVLDDSHYEIKYYNFTDFDNFFKYLSGHQQERIERKISRREARGKELNLNYQLLVHDLIERNGEYLLIAEAYYATYRTEPFTYTTVMNGMLIYQTGYRTVFDGWLYTHAVVAGFDKVGNLVWDNSIEMGDYKSYTLAPRVQIAVEEDRVNLVYATYDEIKSKVIRGHEVLDEKEDVKIETGFEDDRIKRSIYTNAEYWYGNYFLVYGYQQIKNTERESVRRKRVVFYFNKVGYK